MSSPPVLNNTALPILQQQRPPAAARSAADSPAGSVAGSPPSQAGNSQSIFSVSNLNVTATKVRLMERAGKEFGIDQADYESVFSYGSAVKNAVEALKQLSPSAIAGIERQLGLDQLGISLDTLVNAIIDPQGSDGDRLGAALEKQVGDDGKDEGNAASIRPDEIGLYGG